MIAKSGILAPKTQARLHGDCQIKDGTRTFNIVDVADKILDTSLDIPVKAVMIFNHNPVCTHPDQAKMIRALMREDLFIVGSDVVMTDSMAFADVILPAAPAILNMMISTVHTARITFSAPRRLSPVWVNLCPTPKSSAACARQFDL